VRWETKLMGGAHMAMTGGRKDVIARMCNPKEKAPFGEYTKAVQAEWAAWGRRRPMGDVGQHGLVVLDPRRRLKGR
jgi:hypothetical protein